MNNLTPEIIKEVESKLMNFIGESKWNLDEKHHHSNLKIELRTTIPVSFLLREIFGGRENPISPLNFPIDSKQKFLIMGLELTFNHHNPFEVVMFAPNLMMHPDYKVYKLDLSEYFSSGAKREENS